MVVTFIGLLLSEVGTLANVQFGTSAAVSSRGSPYHSLCVMNSSDPVSTETVDRPIPRWVQVPVGLFLGLFTLLCLAGSATLIFSPNEKAPVLAPVLGVVWVAACSWVLEKCLRLITGRKNRGGLMSPRTLRAVGWFFLLLPIGGIFTGYFRTHTLIAIVQTAAYVSVFFGLRRLAGVREDSTRTSEAKNDA